MITALIFDFDGVVVDTETPALRAWQAVYMEFGHELPQERWVDYFMADTFDPLAHLAELCGNPFDREEVNERRSVLKTQMCERQPVLAGVSEWLEQARALSIKTAIASGSRRPWVSQHLAQRGLLEKFDAIVTREEVANPKPAPDLFLLAADRLGVKPTDTLVVEDSPNGLKAALAGGMHCVVVPNGVTEGLDYIPHRWRFKSLAAINLGTFVLGIE